MQPKRFDSYVSPFSNKNPTTIKHVPINNGIVYAVGGKKVKTHKGMYAVSSKHMLNKALKSEIQEVLRRHKVKGMRKHMAHMAGSGIFDIVTSVGKKAMEVGKKLYNIYDKNKEAIHKGIDFGIKHAPKVIDAIQKIKGGAQPIGGKRTLPPALKKWQEDCKAYAKKHSCTFKQAMSALKKH